MIVMPIVPMTAYVLLASIKVFNVVEDMPFVFYIVVGMFIWMLMSSTILKVMASVKKDASILRTNNISILISMLRQLGEILFETLIRVIAVVAVVFWFDINVELTALLFATLSLIPIIVISFSLGIILSVFSIVLQDTRKVVDIFFRYGLFISSVIFPFPQEGILGFINSFNIFNTFIVGFRELLFYGSLTHVDLFGYSSLVAVLLFVFAIRLTYVFDYKLREYL
jgi:ABC-type polysaccharide/polyol phosphate export permease